ncbi:MAG: oligosaccharyl transferase, archaeosortase A system-associated [Methanomicrobiales archaeon]|nr:oligosaccharyl transferase, archaeosortase A system-associated [Methanomicrobiales archaeon]
MQIQISEREKKLIIAGAILLIAVFMLWMRFLPSENLLKDGNYILGQEPDISYNLRLIEITLHNFPGYPWFEPMTKYPFGTDVRWGPMFTMIVSILCILTGATTRPEIAAIAFAVPPILAVAMVPVMYWLGRRLADRMTGVIAAIFISVVSGQFLYRSLFGFADHHIAEVLFSTIFCLVYIVAIARSRESAIDFRDIKTMKEPLLLGCACGIAFVLGLYTMPTMVFFALIATVFTLVQFIWNHLAGISSRYLVLINTMTFAIACIGLLALGIKDWALYFVHFTPAHLFAYIAVIVGTWYLYTLSSILKEKKWHYSAAIFLTASILIALLLLLAPEIYGMIIGNLLHFFGEAPTTFTIQELRPWTLEEAWATYHFGFLLAIGGLGVLLYNNYRKERPEQIFVFIWAVIVIFSAFRHVRYDYYLSPVIALLAAIFVGAIISYTIRDTWALVSKKREEVAEQESKDKSGKRSRKERVKEQARKPYDPVLIALFFFTMAIALLFVSMSLNYNYAVGKAMGYNTMHPDWRETLEWMNGSTPDPGVDYLTIYEKNTFQYPPQSYGVMSWWDYGHWITFFAKRIPHANPFQDAAGGLDSASQFFIASDEKDAVRIANNITTRYVVTDIEMDTGKFWAMATWYNETLGASPYQMSFYMTSPENPLTYELVTLYRQNYFLAMISRLHNFDGSMAVPSRAYYIEYREGTAKTNYMPVIAQARLLNTTEAKDAENAFNRAAPSGSRATVLSSSLIAPIEPVPALQHFRLIHESPTNVLGERGDLRYVKAFEYVKGARIRGEGVIEIDLMTNTGRTFTYRQESVDGEFIVPYSTERKQYDITPLGNYRIAGTEITFNVTEEAVMNGYYIN